MPIGLIGRKAGMTRIFSEDGVSTPVTVIEVTPNRVSQVRTAEADGYSAIQVMAGHLAKAGVEAGSSMMEFRLDEGEGAELQAGSTLGIDMFEAGQKVDVQGTSKGKGFAGAIKRHNFRSQRMTHGNSLSHRAPGSIGQNQSPGRVFKGKRMAGQMGNVPRTQQNLEVLRVDAERNLILVKGAVPGATGGDLVVRHSVKQKNKG
jgi:large subunit ribosomal protein L3